MECLFYLFFRPQKETRFFSVLYHYSEVKHRDAHVPGSPAARGRQCHIVLPRQRLQTGPLLFRAILYHSDVFPHL